MCWPFLCFTKNEKYNFDYFSPENNKNLKTSMKRRYTNTPIFPKKCNYCNKLVYTKKTGNVIYHKECEISQRIIDKQLKKQLSI